MTKEILICGFGGETNTAKLLLDKINFGDKVYLVNDMDKSVQQIVSAIKGDKYDLVILLGKSSAIVRCIDIEKSASQGTEVYMSNFDFTGMRNFFMDLGYSVNVTHESTNYLCNNAFFNCLKYISNNNLKAKSVLVHIPGDDNILCLEKLGKNFENFLKGGLKC